MTEGFGPKVSGFDHFKYADLKSLKSKISKKTAAVFLKQQWESPVLKFTLINF